MKIGYFTRNKYDNLRWEWILLGTIKRGTLFVTTPLFTFSLKMGVKR